MPQAGAGPALPPAMCSALSSSESLYHAEKIQTHSDDQYGQYGSANKAAHGHSCFMCRRDGGAAPESATQHKQNA